MNPARDPFPLATALTRIVDEQAPELIGGKPCDLMSQVSTTTAELLRFWFEQGYCDTRFLNFHEGQRAAILHAIYAHEVLHPSTLRDLYEAVAPEAQLVGSTIGEVSRARHGHPKYAAKMATGTGKTWVLNALLLWQYLNKIAEPADGRFTSNFLLVAPGLVVYERLLDSRTPDMVSWILRVGGGFDAVGDLQVGAGVAGVGVGEFGAERCQGSAASGGAGWVEPDVQGVADDL